MAIPDPAPSELPAVYLADPFAVGPLGCPRCGAEVVIEDVAAHGRGARRTARCQGCGLRLSQETRPIPGRRVA